MVKSNSIETALPTSGHSPVYVMHKFFARKQEDVIRRYIQQYSKEGEIILDPFCGSGVIIGEAIRLNRKAIGIDINPVSIFITRNSIKCISDLDTIIEEFRSIENDIKDELNSLYLTTCRECGVTIPAICYTWDNGKLVDVRYKCPQHNRKISVVNENDLRVLRTIESRRIPEFFNEKGECHFWYPNDKLYYEDGTPFLKKERYNSVDELFTTRNLIALAKLIGRIQEINNKKEIQETFKFAFSSMTHLASKMTPVRPSRPFSSSWVQQSYWYCKHFMESNVWNLFERAVMGNQGLLRAKKSLTENYRYNKEANNVELLIKDKDYDFSLIQASINTLDKIKENSIDYVIADPPYGHSIQYGELLFMWGSWLRLLNDFNNIAKEEIVANPRQKKGVIEYEKMLQNAFKKIFTLLKPERYCTVTFHNPNLKYRNILFKSVIMAGFELEKIIYQPPPRPSAKSLLQPFGSQIGDYFYRFKKPKLKRQKKFIQLSSDKLESFIVNCVKQIILAKGEPVHYTDIQNALDPTLYEKLHSSGLLMQFQPENVEKILKKHIGTIFTLEKMQVKFTNKRKLSVIGWSLVNQKDTL